MKKKVRIGLIGCGSIASKRVEGYQQADGAAYQNFLLGAVVTRLPNTLFLSNQE